MNTQSLKNMVKVDIMDLTSRGKSQTHVKFCKYTPRCTSFISLTSFVNNFLISSDPQLFYKQKLVGMMPLAIYMKIKVIRAQARIV